ncbi:hypothetical protein PAMP_011574 [Pampus punctatissimus]
MTGEESRAEEITAAAPPLDAMALAISVGDTHDTEGESKREFIGFHPPLLRSLHTRCSLNVPVNWLRLVVMSE